MNTELSVGSVRAAVCYCCGRIETEHGEVFCGFEISEKIKTFQVSTDAESHDIKCLH